MAYREEVWLVHLNQTEVTWLTRQSVPSLALTRPTPLLVATGSKAHDGVFDHADGGERWFAFEQEDDYVFWHARRNVFATYANRAFAIGEEIIHQAATYSFDCSLNIFDNPLDWLRARRDGIVVLDWTRAFDRLRDAPRIALAESLLPLYRRHMRPSRLPELFILPARKVAA